MLPGKIKDIINEMKSMRAIYYDSNKIREDEILYGLLEVGIDADRSTLVVELDDIVDEQVEFITKEVREYDMVITRSLSVNVAEGCHISGIPYIAWCFDSPVRALLRKEALYPTNRIFVFDKKHLERLKESGLTNVYHQPLAANMIKASKVRITDEDIIKYDRDVSFVGRTYNKGYYSYLTKDLYGNSVKECEELFDNMLCTWNRDESVFDRLSDPVIEELYTKIDKTGRSLYNMSDRFLTEYLVLVIELTSRERVFLLNRSAELFKTIVHTYDPEKYGDIILAELRPPLKELSDELYRVYAASKINLNITMRSIETGVPQRVFDIMSVGGCVFSNYQEEAEEMFIPDKEIILFKSVEEFTDKAEYYINHERERLEIGARGYLKVRDKYNYPNAMRSIISKL